MCIQNDVPEMVLIPSGEFLMGAVNDDDMGFTGASREEKPQHMVDLEAYTIDTHLVSVERYHRFIQAVDYRPESWQDNWLNAPLQPVRSISLSDVLEYCDWAGRRLPTEAEWEKAARGGLVNMPYPWGDDAFDGSQAADRKKEEGPPDVGMFPPNGYGLYDVVGSLWQWCRDDRRLYTNDRRHRPVGPLGGETRSARGGRTGIPARFIRDAPGGGVCVWQVGRAIWDSDVFATISRTDWAALTTCLFDFGKEALQQTLLLGWNRRRGYHIPSVHQFSLK